MQKSVSTPHGSKHVKLLMRCLHHFLHLFSDEKMTLRKSQQPKNSSTRIDPRDVTWLSPHSLEEISQALQKISCCMHFHATNSQSLHARCQKMFS